MNQTVWERIRESLTWLSVQVQMFWGVVWLVYSQLPQDVLQEINSHKVGFWVIQMTMTAWMGIAQTVMTYAARIRKGSPPTDKSPN